MCFVLRDIRNKYRGYAPPTKYLKIRGTKTEVMLSRIMTDCWVRTLNWLDIQKYELLCILLDLIDTRSLNWDQCCYRRDISCLDHNLWVVLHSSKCLFLTTSTKSICIGKSLLAVERNQFEFAMNRNTSHSHFITPGWLFNLGQDQQCMKRMFRMKIMCGFCPSVFVARSQLCYDRILFVRFITNDRVSKYDDDSYLPDLENFYDDKYDSSDLADNSDKS